MNVLPKLLPIGISVIALALTACSGAKPAEEPSASPAATPAGANPAAGGKTKGLPKRQVAGGNQGGKTEDVRTSDTDGDGTPEVYKYYKTGADPERPGEQKTILVRQDIDVNWDGRIDIWRYFAQDGTVEKEEWDNDYDGKVDETRVFEAGVIVRAERDRNNDGTPDVTRYYKGGKLERKESDTNHDGKVDRWEYYTGRVLDRVGIDKDHDGSVDSWAKKKS